MSPLLKAGLRTILRILFAARITGLENLPQLGSPAILTPNHVSYLDAVLVAAFVPGDPVFAIDTRQAQRWWVKPLLKFVDACPIDSANPMSMKTLIKLVASGRTCVIFPEGRLTRSGTLMKIYDGPAMIADRAQAPIIPMRIAGAEFFLLTHLKGIMKQRLFPRIALTVMPARALHVAPEIKGRKRRQMLGSQLYDAMSDMMFATSGYRTTLFDALRRAAHDHGSQRAILEDINRQPLTYRKILLGSYVLGTKLVEGTKPAEAIGLLLPNVAAAGVAFFGLQAMGRVPAMLNFTAGPANIAAACEVAHVATVVTSRKFVEQGRLEAVIAALANRRVIYLEDVRETISLADKLRGLYRLKRNHPSPAKPDDRAVILFTSGSEGKPKAVALSHANIVGNIRQIAARMPFGPADKVLNALPVFHSFGLTGGFLLPILCGVSCFLYPSPLHYRIVPELAYDIDATAMFGTDTFLAGYARTAHPYDFHKLRLVVAGAEKVRDDTRAVWMEKFGIRILEGYGATETAPVITVNTPMQNRLGTTGRLLPGMEARLEAVPGIETGGQLLVRGPNVMLGYLDDNAPGGIRAPADGWYDTGDIVTIDSDGYIRIEGRVKRFAKIAGEMIALGRVEEEVRSLWPDYKHAVIAVADARKGEQLLLVTDRPGAARTTIADHFKNRGLPELMLPRMVKVVEKLPLLGTGKTDYQAVKDLAAKEST
jgi:acyl-[acyl-carrier-protein]-phospholipid O-acyltransferase/long-chain-fatty-acid--[acyl-carrier-protein] ligase